MGNHYWESDGRSTIHVLKALHGIKKNPDNLDFVITMTRYISITMWNGFSKDWQQKLMPIINPTSKQIDEIIEKVKLIDEKTPVNQIFSLIDSTFLEERN